MPHMATFSTACRMTARGYFRELRLQPMSRDLRTSVPCSAAQNFTMPALDPGTTSEPQAEAPPASKTYSSTSVSLQTPSGNANKQTHPLLPSVEHLLHEHGLDASAVDDMTPSGPNNRLLKGDVLAYLGSISKSYPSELSSKISKLSHLDLSQIRIAPTLAPPKPAKEASPKNPALRVLEIAVPISMKAAIEAQKKVQSSLGVFMPLSTFISRATEIANDDLPRSRLHKPSSNELFNEVLGLAPRSPIGVKGSFMPRIAPLLPTHSTTSKPPSTRKADIIELLAGRNLSRRSTSATTKSTNGPLKGTHIFSVTAQKGDEKRAVIFLDRVKVVLEGEPGRLVL